MQPACAKLAARAQFFGKSVRDITDSLPSDQIRLMQQWFGSGQKGLARLRQNSELPAGMQRRTLEAYRELIRRRIKETPESKNISVAIERLKFVESALSEQP